MTQTLRVLSELKRHSLTAQDALQFGCFRLAARVHDLRAKGHEIETRMEPHDGGKHARYFLKGRAGFPAKAGTKQR